MLTVLRKVFSFVDWSRSHPNEPPPGDMLDASFDAQDQKISEIESLVESVRRSDGALQNGIVTRDSLSPEIYGDLRFELQLASKKEREKAAESAGIAISAAKRSSEAQKRAEEAELSARADANVISTARNSQIAQISALIERSTSLLTALRDAKESLDGMESHEGHSEAWAESSRLWAEHMPDTLPDNALKMMDITGDHWSSRWWANRADNAFGRLTDLYLGAWPTPPLTNLEGGPIQPGSIYFDTDPPPGQMYVWTGSNWASMTSPQRAAVATLWYSSAAGQTVFPMTVNDLYGHNFTITASAPEALNVYVNGVKLMPYVGGLGDWTISGSTVTFERPLRLEDLVSMDIFLPDEALAPGSVNVWSLVPISGQDGVKTAFSLVTKAGSPVVSVTKSEELVVSLDGVVQEPGVSYSASGATITFATAPAGDSKTFLTWFRSV